MTTWFASDVHLDATQPDLADAFVAFMRERVAGADRFYVLGDLFETWVGDDDLDDAKQAVLGTLSGLARDGTQCFFCHGNRDFLVGAEAARAGGFSLLPDAGVVDLYGNPVLLLHGDTLCTDDVDYQAFRAMVRDPQWQAGFLALPLLQRRAMAQAARDASREGMAHKSADIMDVNEDAVTAAFNEFDVNIMIHGHTHRPAAHRYKHGDSNRIRYVLGDWYDTGRVLRWDANGGEEITL